MKKDSDSSYLYLLIIVIVGLGVMFIYFMIPKIIEQQYNMIMHSNKDEIAYMVVDFNNDRIVIAEIKDIANDVAAVKFIDSYAGVLKIGDIVDKDGNLISRGEDAFAAYVKTLKIEGFYTQPTETVTEDGIVIG